MKPSTTFKKHGKLLIIYDANETLILADKRFSAAEIKIPVYVIPQPDGTICFLPAPEDEKILTGFFSVHTDFEILYSVDDGYYFIRLFDEFDGGYKINDEQEVAEPVVDEQRDKNVFCDVDLESPQLISICFDIQKWKKKNAREFVEEHGFALHCNVTNENGGKSKRGVQRNKISYEFFQNDPADFTDKRWLVYCVKHDKKYDGVILKLGERKPLA